jgi:signal transduction histidine kinase
MSRLLRAFVSPETYRALLFYGAALGLGVAGFILVLAAWPITLALAITPLVVPLLIGLGLAIAALAHAEAFLVRELLGTAIWTAPAARGTGFWGRGFSVLRHGAFWKQQAHLLISWPVALVPLALLSFALQLISVPIWYRWVDSADIFWRSNVDTFAETLPLAAVGFALLIGTAHLLGPWTSISRWLACGLLSGEGETVVRSTAGRRARLLRVLTIDALVATSIALLLVVIWALTTRGYFWPIWPILSLSLVVGIPGWIVLVLERPEITTRFMLGSKALAIQIGISAVLLGFLVAVWALAGGGYFWPIWPALGFALAAIVHAAVLYARSQHRIQELETSRAGAVDVQETELRRIERDLHDGAQARLVALGMSLGMAEQKLKTDPEAAGALLAEARRGAGEALEELRVLARGIHPPILTDRGLEAAVTALTARSPVPVKLSVDVALRPEPAVETAAYFVVAEAVANAIKYAHPTRLDIRIGRLRDTLTVEVEDDGSGGADPGGDGLKGLTQRVQALDGYLNVTSPVGGPTTVRALLPCGS